MKQLKNQKGQGTIEAVLILVIFMGIAVFVGDAFRSNQYIASIVSGPWRQLSGMIQNGAWVAPEDSRVLHPGFHYRHRSTRGEEAR